MYRYDHYYGYWSSDTDSSGGDDTAYAPNKGEGGRDTGYSPSLPDPPDPPEPPATSTLASTTPAIITLNEIDEYANDGGGYRPAGQFTEARAFPLALVKGTKSGSSKMVLVKNQRTNYDYAPMTNEIFRFPYYVPLGANLATLPYPIITWEMAIQDTNGGQTTATMTIEAVNTSAAPTSDVASVTTPFNNSLNITTGQRVFTLVTDQMLGFIPGKFNEFKFRIKISNTALLVTNVAERLKWMISDIQTSVPTGYQFELKLQKNWESYFNIKVVKDTDRNQKGVTTGLTSVSSTIDAIGNNWTLDGTWNWNEYNTALGFKHWEIPATTFTGNWNFKLTPVFFPENDEFCSMEPTLKTPGPKAPWNLLSRHESFYYAPTWMRVSDYAQDISPNPIWYCPRNFRGVVWLKQGTAINDVF